MNTQAVNLAGQRNTIPTQGETAGDRPAWLDPDLYPFVSRYVDIEGTRVHYIDEGTGPVVMFLHGLPAWSFLYRDVIKGLRGRFRVIALDLPGFGLSSSRPGYSFSVVEHAKVVEQFILALDLHDVTLGVHDSGGAIGFGVAGRNPERFKAFIVSNSFAWRLDDYPFIKNFLKVVGSSFFGLLNVNLNLLVRGFLRSNSFSPAEKAAYSGPFQDRSRRKAMHLAFRSLALREDFLLQVEEAVEVLKDRPALILWGKGDSTYNAGFHERFAQTFENSQMEIVFEGNSQTGHFPQEGGSEKIVAAINSWWDTTFYAES
jgi:haloalkane dehalogenase